MSDEPQVTAPPLISPGDFNIVANLLKRMTGIHIGSNKRAMVSGRLAKRLKALGIGSVEAYCDWLQTPGNEAEQDAFVSALTTNMTRFNREEHHFNHLSEHVLPRLTEAARSGRRVRFWSAACSTGEEAFDIAFRLLEICPEAARLDLRILATDIDKSALGTARAGLYPTSSLSDLPASLADRYIDRADSPSGMVRVASTARDLITFRCLNLNAEWPFQRGFDVIMCRNVTIYFDETTQVRLWERLADRVVAGGALYVGHSENLPEHIATSFIQQERGAFCRPAAAVSRQASMLRVAKDADGHRPDINGGLG
ncbi:CheR family methyltransferase [Roseovarius sp.]|uniref:CheR family methyltransferase n=1 Tax=Roseovarius sp. TaxID=1486281 RepID=UPI003B5C424C